MTREPDADDHPNQTAQPATEQSDDVAEARAEAEERARQQEREQRQQPDDETADPSEFFVTRDEEGRIRAVDTEAEGFGKVKVRPMTYGHAERYFGDVGNAAMIEPRTLAEILREHVVEPDLDTVARNQYGSNGLDDRVLAEEMTPFAPAALLMAIMKESGMNADVNVDAQGNAAIEFDKDDSGNRARTR